MPTLNWMGKEAVAEHHKAVPFRLLKEKPELSAGDADSGNTETPLQQGIPFDIPVLALKQGCLFEAYEEQHFLDYEWRFSECDAGLTKAEYSGKRFQGEQGRDFEAIRGKIAIL